MRHHGLGSLHASTEKAHVAGLKPQVLAESFVAVRVVKTLPSRSLHFALRRDGLGHLGRTLRLASRQPFRLDLVRLEFLRAHCSLSVASGVSTPRAFRNAAPTSAITSSGSTKDGVSARTFS